MFQPDPQAADTYLAGLLTRAAAAAAGDVPEMAHLVATAETEDATPWYTQYREAYLRMLAFGAHETMDHPVACERWFLQPLLRPASKEVLLHQSHTLFADARLPR